MQADVDVLVPSKEFSFFHAGGRKAEL
jgi:hypothetical protein